MTSEQRLVIFDVDGTLVDSQAHIIASMADAFEAVGLAPPSRSDILAIVGLSLPVAMSRIARDADIDQMVQAYKDSYVAHRAAEGSAQSSPLYPGARAVLDRLHALPDVLLGIATGKSRRGLDILLEAHDLKHLFATEQVADFHHSKPHPGMLHAALDETGTTAQAAVMIGDTTFDMDMAQAANMPFVGVSWGYHPTTHLRNAVAILDAFDDLDDILKTVWDKNDE